MMLKYPVFRAVTAIILSCSPAASQGISAPHGFADDGVACVLENGKKAQSPAPRGLFFGRQLFRPADIVSANAGFDKYANTPMVTILFTKLAGRRFAAMTKRRIGLPMPVFLDGKLLSCPFVNEPILGGQVQISGGFTAAEAATMAAQIRRGSK